MSQEQLIIGYDQFEDLSLQERIKVFNEISAENRALLMKTQVERWLAANHPRLTQEQVAVIEEIICSVTPESYDAKRDYAKITQEADRLYAKAEAVFSREDIMQFGFLSRGQCSIR